MVGKWIVIGGGNMGGALVRGMIAAGVCGAEGVVVAEPDMGKREGLRGLGVRAVGGVGEAAGMIGTGSALLLAVKPQMFAGVAAELTASCGPAVREGCVVVSIMAGVTTGAIAQRTGAMRVVRAMPNLPATVGVGMTAMARGAGASEADGAAAERLFAAVGECVWLDEGLMDAFTGLAGSGPAYVFALCEAMSAAGVRLGMSPADAAAAARQTVIGAARLLEASALSPGELRASVASKGGTTQAALEVLRRGGFEGLMAQAIEAAARRGAELSGGQ